MKGLVVIISMILVFAAVPLAFSANTFSSTNNVFIPSNAANDQWQSSAPSGKEHYKVQGTGANGFAQQFDASGNIVMTRSGNTNENPNKWTTFMPPNAKYVTPAAPSPTGSTPQTSGTVPGQTNTQTVTDYRFINGQLVTFGTENGRPTITIGGMYDPKEKKTTAPPNAPKVVLPKGTRLDDTRYDPTTAASRRIIPISGGGKIVLDSDAGNKYNTFDKDNRQTGRTQDGATSTFDFASKSKPSGYKPDDPTTWGDFGKRTSETRTVEGVDGRVTIPWKSDGSGSVLPDKLDTPGFTRAALAAGISKVDPTKIDSTNPRFPRLVQGGRTIMNTDRDNIVSFSGTASNPGDDWRLFVQKDTQSEGQTYKAGSEIRFTGDGVGEAIDPATGAIDPDKLPDGSYTFTAHGPPDAKGRRTSRAKTFDQKGGTETVRGDSTCDPAKKSCTWTTTDDKGNSYSGTAGLDFADDRVDSNWAVIPGFAGRDGFTHTAATLKKQTDRQFGPNAQIYQFGDGTNKRNLYNINGAWKYIDDRGQWASCFPSFSDKCQGVSEAELDAFEDNVIDPQARANGKPSTNALQFGQFLTDFTYYASAYQGFAGWSSIMFSEEFLEDWKRQVDAIFCDMLHIGGIDCWTSQICDAYVDVEEPQGTLVGRSPDGSPRSIAHIEAERSPPIQFEGANRKELIDIFGERTIIVQGQSFNLSDPDVDLSNLPPITARIYKVTFAFSATENSIINVLFSGERDVKWYNPDFIVQEGTTQSRIRSNPIMFISPTNYDKVCLIFNPPQAAFGGRSASTFDPSAVFAGGRSVSQQCTVISEYDGGATPPANAGNVTTGAPSSAPAGSPAAPTQGAGI